MVKDCAEPAQLFAVGVTLTVATTFAAPELTAGNAVIFPSPLAARPMEVVLFVQLNVVLATAPVKFTASVETPLQRIWSEGSVTVGVGFTAMVKDCAVPVHPFAEGVTLIVAVTIDVPELVPVNAAMFPEPLAARPMEVVLFVQLSALPATVPEKFTAPVDVLLQILWSEGSLTVGVG